MRFVHAFLQGCFAGDVISVNFETSRHCGRSFGYKQREFWTGITVVIGAIDGVCDDDSNSLICMLAATTERVDAYIGVVRGGGNTAWRARCDLQMLSAQITNIGERARVAARGMQCATRRPARGRRNGAWSVVTRSSNACLTCTLAKCLDTRTTGRLRRLFLSRTQKARLCQTNPARRGGVVLLMRPTLDAARQHTHPYMVHVHAARVVPEHRHTSTEGE